MFWIVFCPKIFGKKYSKGGGGVVGPTLWNFVLKNIAIYFASSYCSPVFYPLTFCQNLWAMTVHCSGEYPWIFWESFISRFLNGLSGSLYGKISWISGCFVFVDPYFLGLKTSPKEKQEIILRPFCVFTGGCKLETISIFRQGLPGDRQLQGLIKLLIIPATNVIMV